jgi:hypothetical protein
MRLLLEKGADVDSKDKRTLSRMTPSLVTRDVNLKKGRTQHLNLKDNIPVNVLFSGLV